jgi:ABC-2 type transport system ATP-binding protein
MNQGRLIVHALPETLLQAVEGKVWQFTVGSDRLTAVRQQYLISNTMRRQDGVQVRCVGAEPVGETAVSVSATLEDAYLYFINNNREGAA